MITTITAEKFSLEEITKFAAYEASEREKREDRVKKSSTHDPLCDIANVNGIFNNFKQTIQNYVTPYLTSINDQVQSQPHQISYQINVINALENSYTGDARRKNKGRITLCAFDLDHFKSINDEYGHKQGDAVLVDFGMNLNTLGHRQGDISGFTSKPGRKGGEEFVLILEDTDVASAKKIIDQFRDDLVVYRSPENCRNENQPDLLSFTSGISSFEFSEISEKITQLYETFVRSTEFQFNKNGLDAFLESETFNLYLAEAFKEYHSMADSAGTLGKYLGRGITLIYSDVVKILDVNSKLLNAVMHSLRDDVTKKLSILYEQYPFSQEGYSNELEAEITYESTIACNYLTNNFWTNNSDNEIADNQSHFSEALPKETQKVLHTAVLSSMRNHLTSGRSVDELTGDVYSTLLKENLKNRLSYSRLLEQNENVLDAQDEFLLEMVSNNFDEIYSFCKHVKNTIKN